jgi:anaerobic ribonucleoside-triphosphate reductase
MTKCNQECEIFSRVVGYFRPVKRWNDGKKEEFKERLEFTEKNAMKKEIKCGC